MRPTRAVFCVLLLGSPAFADDQPQPPPAPAAEQPPPTDHSRDRHDDDEGRTWISAGFIGGTTRVGTAFLSGGGVLMTGGHAFGPLHLQAEYNYTFLSDNADVMPLRADQHRIGGTARLVWWQLGSGRTGVDFAFEAGFGYTFLNWEKGGRVNRADGLIGMGSQMLVGAVGVNYGVRVGVAGSDFDSSLQAYVGLSFAH